jgi:hypothetical protein
MKRAGDRSSGASRRRSKDNTGRGDPSSCVSGRLHSRPACEKQHRKPIENNAWIRCCFLRILSNCNTQKNIRTLT